MCRTSGTAWVKDSSTNNSFYHVSLSQGDSTELFFSHLLAPPAGRVACLTFRYRKYSTGRLMNK